MYFLYLQLYMNKIGISLGNACETAEWSVQNGFRQRKEDGYQTCPFDLMVSNYKGIIECIYSDFADFCNPEYLSLVEINSERMIINVKYNFGFNHESPDHANLYLHENWPEGNMHFVNNNYAHFIERYNKRIKSFYKYIMNPQNYIVFIIKFKYDINPNDNCSELREAINSKFPHLQYEIIVL